MTKSEREEVIRLTGKLMDRQINRANLARLEELLSESEEAIDLYLEVAHDESFFKELLPGLERPEGEVAEPRWKRLWIPLSAIAAILAVMVLGWYFAGGEGEAVVQETPDRQPSVGVLTGGLGVRWADGTRPLMIGSPLPEQRVGILSGALEVTCSNGVVLLFEGPASFWLRDEMNLELEYGNLVAEVPEAGRGFSVRSGEHQLIDHGTEFGMRISHDGLEEVTEIAVFQGVVEVIPNGTAAPVMLGKYDAVALTSETETGVYSIPLDQSKFLKELPLGEIPWKMPKIPRGQTETIAFEVSELIKGPGQYFAVFKWMGGKSAVSTSQVTLLRDGAGFLSRDPQDFLGKWNYSFDGREYQREFFTDGTAVLRSPDGGVMEGIRWWLEEEVMHMYFEEQQKTERLLLRGGLFFSWTDLIAMPVGKVDFEKFGIFCQV